MDDKELAERITIGVMAALSARRVFFGWDDSTVSALRNQIEEVALKNLNTYYQIQFVPAVSSLPTTCNEPGIAY